MDTKSWPLLVPEPTNLYDANAIAVQIDGQVIGYLPRAAAQEYLPGLQRLMSVRGGYVALRGVIVGGGYYDDGPGRARGLAGTRPRRLRHPLNPSGVRTVEIREC